MVATDLTQAPGQLDITELEHAADQEPKCEWPNIINGRRGNSHQCTEVAVARMVYSCGQPHRLICEGAVRYLKSSTFVICHYCGQLILSCRKVVPF